LNLILTIYYFNIDGIFKFQNFENRFQGSEVEEVKRRSRE
jgi:hypothetical protein